MSCGRGTWSEVEAGITDEVALNFPCLFCMIRLVCTVQQPVNTTCVSSASSQQPVANNFQQPVSNSMLALSPTSTTSVASNNVEYSQNSNYSSSGHDGSSYSNRGSGRAVFPSVQAHTVTIPSVAPTNAPYSPCYYAAAPRSHVSTGVLPSGFPQSVLTGSPCAQPQLTTFVHQFPAGSVMPSIYPSAMPVYFAQAHIATPEVDNALSSPSSSSHAALPPSFIHEKSPPLLAASSLPSSPSHAAPLPSSTHVNPLPSLAVYHHLHLHLMLLYHHLLFIKIHLHYLQHHHYLHLHPILLHFHHLLM
ncbi:hypothetical protein V6N11_020605 [Hibiscus sabdariffa]|uniref:Uncharacterized protein n=1 Tax=Hibiscus sabdariffa TaxID=183260 RepID=A0ABR2Q8Z4_9ROSI